MTTILLALVLTIDPFCDVASDVAADVRPEPAAVASQKEEGKCDGGTCRAGSRAQADRSDEECASCAAPARTIRSRRGLFRRMFSR